MSVPTEPGIYRSISWEQYMQIDALQRSFMWTLRTRTPGHARQESEKVTKPLQDGTMIHTAILQPEEFPIRYMVMPPFESHPENVTKQGKKPTSPKATVYYKAKVANFESACLRDGVQIVTRDDYDMAYEIAAQIRRHDTASRFFKRGVSTEAVAVWREQKYGYLCKARFDGLVEGELPTAADLKTAEDASDEAFDRSARKYGYRFQAAWYLSGLSVLGLHNPNFIFIVCEKSAPWGINVVEFDRDILHLAWKQVQQSLDIYHRCHESGEWPTYGGGINTIKASKWDLEELDSACGHA